MAKPLHLTLVLASPGRGLTRQIGPKCEPVGGLRADQHIKPLILREVVGSNDDAASQAGPIRAKSLPDQTHDRQEDGEYVRRSAAAAGAELGPFARLGCEVPSAGSVARAGRPE